MSKYAKKKSRIIDIQVPIIFILIAIVVSLLSAAIQQSKYERQIEALTASHEKEMIALRTELQADYESQIAELEKYYEYGGDVTQIEREAEYIAKVIYGTARDHADSDKRAVVWCILNRVEHYGHPNTIAEVCEQPKQWMGYSSENPVLADIYDLALTELKTWYSGGHRPMGNEYIYLTWSSKEILLRDTFEENRNTNYWRMR